MYVLDKIKLVSYHQYFLVTNASCQNFSTYTPHTFCFGHLFKTLMKSIYLYILCNVERICLMINLVRVCHIIGQSCDIIIVIIGIIVVIFIAIAIVIIIIYYNCYYYLHRTLATLRKNGWTDFQEIVRGGGTCKYKERCATFISNFMKKNPDEPIFMRFSFLLAILLQNRSVGFHEIFSIRRLWHKYQSGRFGDGRCNFWNTGFNLWVPVDWQHHGMTVGLIIMTVLRYGHKEQ